MELNKNESIDKKLNGFVGYVPYKLIVEKKPELSVFPLNVLMARYTMREGAKVLANVLYEPDLSSFKVNDDKTISMNYPNRYDKKYYLKMIIGKDYKFRECIKYKDDKNIGRTHGIIDIKDEKKSWHMFFHHLALLGLDNGEHCSFLNLES